MQKYRFWKGSWAVLYNRRQHVKIFTVTDKNAYNIKRLNSLRLQLCAKKRGAITYTKFNPWDCDIWIRNFLTKTNEQLCIACLVSTSINATILIQENAKLRMSNIFTNVILQKTLWRHFRRTALTLSRKSPFSVTVIFLFIRFSFLMHVLSEHSKYCSKITTRRWFQ